MTQPQQQQNSIGNWTHGCPHDCERLKWRSDLRRPFERGHYWIRRTDERAECSTRVIFIYSVEQWETLYKKDHEIAGPVPHPVEA